MYSIPERATASSLFSLFSPPVKTEGGFVPKNPPIMDTFYENAYLTTSVDLNAVTPASIVNSHDTDERK